jgi:hypothetical protein
VPLLANFAEIGPVWNNVFSAGFSNEVFDGISFLFRLIRHFFAHQFLDGTGKPFL